MLQAKVMILTVLTAVYVTPALSERIIPPKQFDHAASNVTVVSRSPAQIRTLCTVKEASPWLGGGVGACTLYTGKDKPCIILWPRGVPKTGVLWRHEQAHCNGWTANHP